MTPRKKLSIDIFDKDAGRDGESDRLKDRQPREKFQNIAI